MVKPNRQDIAINFSNCRNIKKIGDGSIVFRFKNLNLFYGNNGTGKTTIVKVLDYLRNPADEARFKELESFECIENGENEELLPRIDATKTPLSAMIFNADWVKNHCFLPDGGLQQNAYALYVSSEDVKKYEGKRESLQKEFLRVLNSEELSTIQSLTARAMKGIGTDGRGHFTGAYKSCTPLEEIPKPLVKIADPLNEIQRANWLLWHRQGADYANQKTCLCPYCGKHTDGLGEYAVFDHLHSDKQGKAWLETVKVFASGDLYNSRTNNKALKILNGSRKPSEEEEVWILGYAKKAYGLSECLNSLQELSSTDGGFSNEYFSRLREKAQLLKDTIGLLAPIRDSIRKLKGSIDHLVKNEKALQKVIADLEIVTAKVVHDNEDEFNRMLCDCGYPYQIRIANDPARKVARIQLIPSNCSSAVEQPLHALSFGEQNALALVLFMFEALYNKPKLIILDDPISSFDGDKRFALMYCLFAKPDKSGLHDSFFNKTVLLLTHDYLIVSDIVGVLSSNFKKVNALYLKTDQYGVLQMDEIKKEAISPYLQMIRKRIADSTGRDVIFQLLYLRCYCEMSRLSQSDIRTGSGCGFNLISDIMHQRTRQYVFDEYGWNGLEPRPYKVRVGDNFIKKHIPGFTFLDALDEINNPATLIRLYESSDIVSYEKLQLVRLVVLGNPAFCENRIMQRYIDETFHLGGDYLFQLDPLEFDRVPFYVVEWCDEVFETYKAVVEQGINK